MLSLLLLASAVAAQSVTIVTTHSGAQCKGDLTYEYTSFDPAGTCQGTTATQSCTNTQTSGSDSKFAGCFTTSGTVSPGGWVPPTDRASLASNSSYMTLTAYTSNTCSALPSSANSTVSQGFMQTTFAASGKCMSLDLAYFKASCTPSGGSLQFCTDSDCNNCSPATSYTTGCNQIDGSAVSFSCAVPTADSQSTSLWSGKPASLGVSFSNKGSSSGTGQASTTSTKNNAKSARATAIATAVQLVGLAAGIAALL